jgi:hypothetical protein
VARPPTAKVAGFFLFFDTGLLKNQKLLQNLAFYKNVILSEAKNLKGSGA